MAPRASKCMRIGPEADMGAPTRRGTRSRAPSKATSGSGWPPYSLPSTEAALVDAPSALSRSMTGEHEPGASERA
eukprot:scaffold330132_cov137-Tisochrysis_lutea.AAC.1